MSSFPPTWCVLQELITKIVSCFVVTQYLLTLIAQIFVLMQFDPGLEYHKDQRSHAITNNNGAQMAGMQLQQHPGMQQQHPGMQMQQQMSQQPPLSGAGQPQMAVAQQSRIITNPASEGQFAPY